MARTNLTVSVDDDHLNRFAEVVERCEEAGMNVEAKLSSIGVITGSIDSSKVHSMNQIEGVSHIEGARGFQIAPPNSPIQ